MWADVSVFENNTEEKASAAKDREKTSQNTERTWTFETPKSRLWTARFPKGPEDGPGEVDGQL